MLSRSFLTFLALLAPFWAASAFVAPATTRQQLAVSIPKASSTAAFVFGKKKEDEDLSYLETRDMTRDEMLDLNKQNEEIMNMELQMMTAFSVVCSIPILYLCWVAFFSE